MAPNCNKHHICNTNINVISYHYIWSLASLIPTTSFHIHSSRLGAERKTFRMNEAQILNEKNIKTSEEAYSKPCQTSKMELFAEIVTEFQPLNILVKNLIFYVWLGSGGASAMDTRHKLKVRKTFIWHSGHHMNVLRDKFSLVRMSTRWWIIKVKTKPFLQSEASVKFQ